MRFGGRPTGGPPSQDMKAWEYAGRDLCNIDDNASLLWGTGQGTRKGSMMILAWYCDS